MRKIIVSALLGLVLGLSLIGAGQSSVQADVRTPLEPEFVTNWDPIKRDRDNWFTLYEGRTTDIWQENFLEPDGNLYNLYEVGVVIDSNDPYGDLMRITQCDVHMENCIVYPFGWVIGTTADGRAPIYIGNKVTPDDTRYYNLRVTAAPVMEQPGVYLFDYREIAVNHCSAASSFYETNGTWFPVYVGKTFMFPTDVGRMSVSTERSVAGGAWESTVTTSLGTEEKYLGHAENTDRVKIVDENDNGDCTNNSESRKYRVSLGFYLPEWEGKMFEETSGVFQANLLEVSREYTCETALFNGVSTPVAVFDITDKLPASFNSSSYDTQIDGQAPATSGTFNFSVEEKNGRVYLKVKPDWTGEAGECGFVLNSDKTNWINSRSTSITSPSKGSVMTPINGLLMGLRDRRDKGLL